MKKHLLIFAAVTLGLVCVSRTASAGGMVPNGPVDLSRQDHALHAGMTTGLTVAFSAAYKEAGVRYPVGLGALSALGIGLIKELALDKQGDAGDMEANTLGALGGVVISFAVLEF